MYVNVPSSNGNVKATSEGATAKDNIVIVSMHSDIYFGFFGFDSIL